MKKIYEEAIKNNTMCLLKSMHGCVVADKLLELGVLSQRQWDSIYCEKNIDLRNQQ